MSIHDQLAYWTLECEDLVALQKIYEWMDTRDLDGNDELSDELELIVREIMSLRDRLHEMTQEDRAILEAITEKTGSISARVVSLIQILSTDKDSSVSNDELMQIGSMLSGTDQVAYYMVTMWNSLIQRVICENKEKQQNVLDEIRTFIYVTLAAHDHLATLGVLEPLEVDFGEE